MDSTSEVHFVVCTSNQLLWKLVYFLAWAYQREPRVISTRLGSRKTSRQLKYIPVMVNSLEIYPGYG